jgi:hypothetical protein
MRLKEHTPPGLPLIIRFKGPAETLEEEWTFDIAWEELTHRVETELKEQTLRLNFSIKEKPHLEWAWHDEHNRGGMECTILVHIHTGPSGASVQKRKHLQWIALDQIQNLNNEVSFTVPAHNLFKKTGEVDSTRQELRNTSASIQASPQAARKKRLTKLDMTILMDPEIDALVSAKGDHNEECEDSALLQTISTNLPRSTSHPVAQSRLNYV